MAIFSPIAVGLCLTLDPSDFHSGHEHFRQPSTKHGPAKLWGWALAQLWLFW